MIKPFLAKRLKSILNVPTTGFEPARRCQHHPLKMASLPISPRGQNTREDAKIIFCSDNFVEHEKLPANHSFFVFHKNSPDRNPGSESMQVVKKISYQKTYMAAKPNVCWNLLPSPFLFRNTLSVAKSSLYSGTNLNPP